MSELKPMKIRIESPTHCAYVQDTLFAAGYRWGTQYPYEKYKPCTENAAWIFAYKDGVLTWDNNEDYGDEHLHEEYVWTPQKKFVKRTDYYRQPETKLSFVQTASDTFMAKYDPVAAPMPSFIATGEQLIAKQKAVADKVLDKLFSIDPFAICAGGAPRDWHFGKPATDLDIFFYTTVEQLTYVSDMLRHVGIDLVDDGKAGERLPDWYKLNPALRCVYSTVVDGVKVQLMLMNATTYSSVVKHFPFSICKAWYKHGYITLEHEFNVAERHKVVVKCNTVYNDEHKYVQKIKAKFPDWQFCNTWEEAYKHAFYNKGK